MWGKKSIRIEVPIQNQRERQTYFGGLNYQTQEFIIGKYSAGNSENTVAFIKALQSQCPGQRLAVIWDGASYHKSVEMKAFLAEVNDGYEANRRQVTCILFAPNAPQQNPVEDVWLQAKNFLRKFWHLCKSFPVAKWLFNFFAAHQKFDFPKLRQYTPDL